MAHRAQNSVGLLFFSDAIAPATLQCFAAIRRLEFVTVEKPDFELA
jgi:hypothetical protein